MAEHCGRSWDEEDKHCGECGRSLSCVVTEASSSKMSGATCRHLVDPEDTYCGECGIAVRSPPAQELGLRAVLRVGGRITALLFALSVFAIPLSLYLSRHRDADHVLRPSPVLLLVLLAGMLVLLAKLGSVSLWLASKGTFAAAAVIVLLVVAPAASVVHAFNPQLAAPVAEPVRQTFAPLISPSAWQAITSVSLRDDVRAVAPLVVRDVPQVPRLPPVLQDGRAVTVFAVPAASPPLFQPVAIANDRGVLPITTANASVWQRLAPGAVPVAMVVLLPNARPAAQDPAFGNPAIREGECTTCWSQVQLDINPAYAEKMAWQFTQIVALAVTVPRTYGVINGADLMALGPAVQEVVRVGSTQGWSAAGNLLSTQFRDWSGGKLQTGAVKALLGPVFGLDPMATGVTLSLARLTVSEATRGAESWSWQVTKVSGGTLDGSSSSITWNSIASTTYRGTFLQQGWTSTTTTNVTETSGLPPQPLDGPPAYNPPPVYNPPAYNPPPVYNPPVYNPPVYNPPPVNPR